MKYMGSKARIVKHILPIMLSERKENQFWIEPFVGGGNVIEKVSGNRIGADINPYVIQALIAIRDNVSELPKNNKEFTENDYKKLREYDDYKFKGYAGFALSYGGKWLGGWCRDSKQKRDYVAEAYRSAIKQNLLLQSVSLICSDYRELNIPENSLIYCDIPYKNSGGYGTKFNHELFWDWCKEKNYEGHTIFVSEYNAPDFFECVWQGELCSSLTKNTGAKKSIEKLFRLKG